MIGTALMGSEGSESMADREKIVEAYAEYEPYAHALPCVTIKSQVYMDVLDLLKRSKIYEDQIKWERDVALRQLSEIGKGFGERMDDIVRNCEREKGTEKWKTRL